MPKKITKIFSFLLCFLLIFQQSGFSQIAGELDLSSHFARLGSALFQPDTFRPLHLRYLSYDPSANNFNLLLDKGDQKGTFPKGTHSDQKLKEETKTLLNYFFIGISLPNESFWVNLRPDSPNNIIDPELAETDIGKVFLEADLQLKKDTASFTSPQTAEGKEYWDKLYKKAEELYGNENITIPTLTRPWIVPDEIIIRESSDNAYIYKATLKVMLEQDYLKGSSAYNFQDQRSKALNEYSSQLIRETIIPKLTKEINSSKRYAPLRQVYYSLILAQWFKQRYKKGLYPKGTVPSLIDSQNLSNLASKEDWDKTTYFNEYKKSFAEGEYNIKEPVYTPTGQVIRSYFSGGIKIGDMSPVAFKIAGSPVGNKPYLVPMRFDQNGIVTQPLAGSSPISQLTPEQLRLIDNKMMDSLLSRFPNYKEANRKLLEEFLTMDHSELRKIFAQINRLSDKEILDRVDAILRGEEKLSTNPEWLKEYTLALVSGRHLTLRELFLRPTVGGKDLSQVFLTGFPDTPDIMFFFDKRPDDFRRLIEEKYLFMKAIELLSRQFDLVWINEDDINELSAYLAAHIVKHRLTHETALSLLSLGDILEPFNTTQSQESLKNLLTLVDKLQAENQQWRDIFSSGECKIRLNGLRMVAAIVSRDSATDSTDRSSSTLWQRPGSHSSMFSAGVEAVKESLSKKPLKIFNSSGKRLNVFQTDDYCLLKVPTYYNEDVYDEDGIAIVTIRKTKIDYKKYIKPGYDLALSEIGSMIPAMREIRDFYYIDERGNKKYEEWGYLQERLPFTLGERLRQLYKERQWDKIEEYRKKFVAYQYEMWKSGVWDHDLNILENYGVTEEDNIELLDIDTLSVTNDPERYPYDPEVYLGLRHHAHWSQEYQNIAYDFIAPILDELQINEFNQIINRKITASPLTAQERVRILLEENEGLNNILRGGIFKDREIDPCKKMIRNFLQIPFRQKDERLARIDSESKTEKIEKARLMWDKGKWGPSIYWGLSLEQGVFLQKLPSLPNGQAYDFAPHILSTCISAFAGSKEDIDGLLKTSGTDKNIVDDWLKTWEITYRYLWAAKILYESKVVATSSPAASPAAITKYNKDDLDKAAQEMVALWNETAHEILSPLFTIGNSFRVITSEDSYGLPPAIFGKVKVIKGEFQKLNNLVLATFRNKDEAQREKLANSFFSEAIPLISSLQQRIDDLRSDIKGFGFKVNWLNIDIALEDQIAAAAIGLNQIKSLLSLFFETKERAKINIKILLALVKNQFNSQKIVVLSNDYKVPNIIANPTELNQVFRNLVANALHAIEGQEDGKVVIVPSSESDKSGIYLKVVIADNGHGIPAENLTRIFEPYFTTKGDKGTGLGLPIVKRIIEENGGTITVESAPGKGTTFTIKLPVASSLSVADSDTAASPMAPKETPNSSAIEAKKLLTLIARIEPVMEEGWPKPVSGTQIKRVYRAFDKDDNKLPFVIKVPQKDMISIFPRNILPFVKDYMGGIIAPFAVVEGRDAVLLGEEYPFLILQRELVTFPRGAELSDRYVLPNGSEVNLQEKKKKLLLEIVKKGIFYEDIAGGYEEYGLDSQSGELYLFDFSFPKFEESDDLFHGYLDTIRYELGWSYKEDKYLQSLWAAERDKCYPVPDVTYEQGYASSPASGDSIKSSVLPIAGLDSIFAKDIELRHVSDGEKPILLKYEGQKRNNSWDYEIYWLGNKVGNVGLFIAPSWHSDKQLLHLQNIRIWPESWQRHGLSSSIVDWLYFTAKKNNLDFTITGDDVYLERALERAKAKYGELDGSGSSSMGGVDIRHLAKNTVIERGTSSNLLKGSPSGTDPSELQEIQRLIQAGIIPATKRLEECRGACSSEALLSCIADILRIEEERVTATEAGLKNLLASL